MKTKTSIFLIIFFASFFLSVDAFSQNTVYTTTVKHHNVYFQTGRVVLDNNGFVTQGILGVDHPFTNTGGRGVRFKAGYWVRFDNRGLVYEGHLANDHPFTIIGGRGIKFMAGTLIKFNPAGLVYEGYLANDHPLGVVGGRSAFNFKKGTQIKINSAGYLYEGTTANAIAMTLSNGRTVNIPAGTLVIYDTNGKVSNYNPR